MFYVFRDNIANNNGKGNGNPLQYSCLGNYMGRGGWWSTVHGGHKESDMTEQLNNKISINNMPKTIYRFNAVPNKIPMALSQK